MKESAATAAGATRPARTLPRAFATTALACAAFAALPSFAEVVTVRSGEHEGFSRIVISPATPTGWRLGRAGRGYELRLDREDISFDLAGVYRLIPRDRLAAVSPGLEPGTLAIGLGCDCHATAFETANGLIAVDVSDGPAEPDSEFEVPFDPPPDARSPVSTSTPDAVSFLPWTPARRSYLPVAEPDPRLDIYWSPMRKANVAPDVAAPPPVGKPVRAGVAMTNTDPAVDATPVVNDDGATAQLKPTVHPQIDRTVTDEAPDASGPATVAEPTLPPHSPLVIPLPSARAAETERALLEQLGRAAAQGLVTARDAGRPVEATDFPGAGEASDAGEPVAAEVTTESAGSTLAEHGSGDAADDHLAVRSETGIDRDALNLPEATPRTSDGETCLSDTTIRVSDWGDDRPATEQIAERRASLVGEFDLPDEEAALLLTKLFLYLGFGAEASTTLDVFAPDAEETPLLRDLARIVDGDPVGAESPFLLQGDCDTAAALWSALAQPAAMPEARREGLVPSINAGAALRTFAALPPHLRATLGSRLADVFLAAGQPDVARAVRDAMARTPLANPRSVGLIDARIDLGAGRAEAAEPKLDSVAAGNDQYAPEALILAIQSRIARGAAVDPPMTEAVAALAFEHRNDVLGERLTQVHALALSSEGRHDEAIALLSGPGVQDAAIRRETTLQVFAQMVEFAPEVVFLAGYLAHADVFQANDAPEDLQLQIAERLVAANLGHAARDVLSEGAAASEQGRVILARAALADERPEEAVQLAEGLSDPVAVLLRAEALRRLGDETAAADAFHAAGQDEEAGRSAWRAGDYARAAELGAEETKATLAMLGLMPPDLVDPVTAAAGATVESAGDEAASVVQPAPTGPIGTGKSLLSESTSLREKLAPLLAAPGESAASAP